MRKTDSSLYWWAWRQELLIILWFFGTFPRPDLSARDGKEAAMFECLTLRQQDSGKKVSAMYIYHPAASSIKQPHRGISICLSTSRFDVCACIHFLCPASSHSFSHINIHFLILLILLFSLSLSLSPTSVLVCPDLLWFLSLSFSLFLFFLKEGSNYTPRSAGRVRWKVGIVCWATATRCCSHPSCTDQ